MATNAASNPWVRPYTKDDGTRYHIAYRTNTTWAKDSSGAPQQGSLTTNLQCDLIAIDADITGGGMNATWTDAATRGPGAGGQWTRRYKDDAATNLGFVMPDAGWLDLNDRKGTFSSQVNNNTAQALSKVFTSEGYGRTFGMDSQAGAMKEIARSQGSGNAALTTLQSAITGNLYQVTSLQDASAQQDNNRKAYGTDGRNKQPLYYPTALKNNSGQDKLHIEVLEYKPRKPTEVGYELEERANMKRNVIGRVTLPVPGGVGDQNSVSWGPDTMNAKDLALANIAFDTIEKADPEAGAKKAEETLRAAASDPETKKAIAGIFTKAATGVNFLTRKTGKIANPNMELLFNAPTPRPFAFTYRMSPRDRQESVMVKKIIRLFKQSMSVQKSSSALFLETPNTYKLKWISQGGREHQFLPKIKECALTGFNVNYTPDGNYATYEDSSMISYEVQFNFMELEPIYNTDYADLDNNRDEFIGY